MRLFVVLFFFTLLPSSFALLDGVSEEWEKHAYLVKVFATSSPTSVKAIACSGSVISPRLVITSADCVMDDGKRLSEILVVIPRTGRSDLRKRGEVVDVKGTRAVIRLVHALHVTDMCPSSTAWSKSASSPRLSAIGIRPSLRQESVKAFDLDTLDRVPCRIVGFKTTESTVDFVKQRALLVADLILRRTPSSEYLIAESPANNGTACYEDGGAPIECEVRGRWVQIAFLTSLNLMGHPVHDDEDNEVHMSSPQPLSIARRPRESKMLGNGTEEDSALESNETRTVPAKNAEAGPVVKLDNHDDDEKETTAPKKESSPFLNCLMAVSIRVDIVEVQSLAALIEQHDFAGYVATFEACGLGVEVDDSADISVVKSSNGDEE